MVFHVKRNIRDTSVLNFISSSLKRIFSPLIHSAIAASYVSHILNHAISTVMRLLKSMPCLVHCFILIVCLDIICISCLNSIFIKQDFYRPIIHIAPFMPPHPPYYLFYFLVGFLKDIRLTWINFSTRATDDVITIVSVHNAFQRFDIRIGIWNMNKSATRPMKSNCSVCHLIHKLVRNIVNSKLKCFNYNRSLTILSHYFRFPFKNPSIKISTSQMPVATLILKFKLNS